MALLLIEGFDHVGTGSTAGARLRSKWGANLVNLDGIEGGGRKGSACARLRYGSDYIFYNVNSATATVGCAFKPGANGAQLIMRWSGDNGSVPHVTLSVNANGGLSVHRGNMSTLLGSSPNGLIVPNAWHYIEMSVTLHDSAGTVDVALNGSPVISLTGQDTKNGGTAAVFDRVGMASNASGSRYQYYDDVYIRDDLIQHGDVRVETLMPSGNGTSSDLTGSDGDSTDNYLLVDELTANDADYVGSDIPGAKDTYALADLSTSDVDVLGVQVTHRAAKSDAGPISGRRVVRSGGTDYSGADLVLGTSFLYYRELLPTDPATGAAWTPSGVNGLEVGWEVRA